jgi:FAD/FMN-containing dehydrogenase
MITSYPTSEAPPRAILDRHTLVEALRRVCGGAVHAPGDPGYDDARQPWIAQVDQRPRAVVYPADADEVAAVVRLAAAARVPVVPQGTGHNAAPIGDMQDAILLRTGAMRDVEVDVENRIARVGAGALWIDVVDAVAPYGLMALHGSSPDVGVAGYSLGGGMGWYARSLGLQTNNLTAVELVLSDGTPVRTSATNEPELFWALRGGGGNFGVVTAFEMKLHPIETAYAGWLIWDWSQTERVLAGWAEWAVGAPDAVTTSLRILQLPDIEDVPPPLRGRQIVAIDGAVLGDDATAEAILAPLRELEPDMDTFERQPAAALVRLHADPEGATPAVSSTTILDSLPQEGIEALVAAAGHEAGTSLLMVELRQLGGALGRPHPGGGALSHLDGQFVTFALGVPMDPEQEKSMTVEAERVIEALHPWSSGRRYLNFTEDKSDPASFYTPEVYERLVELRRRFDPYDRVRANHSL